MLHKLTSGRYVSDEALNGVLGVAAEYGTAPTKCEVESMRQTVARYEADVASAPQPPRPGLLRIIANPGVTFEYDRYEDAVRDLEDVLRLCGVSKPAETMFRVWLTHDPDKVMTISAKSHDVADAKFREIAAIAGFSARGLVTSQKLTPV